MDLIIKLNISNNLNTISPTEKQNVAIYKLKDGKWVGYSLDKRSFDTIYLPSETLKNIKNEINTFIEKEKLYREYQIPYKKGLLFYGPPGTGKTSLVKSLAYEYQLNIYIININDDDVNDDSIVEILNLIGNNKNKILLFEDVDSAFADKEKIAVQSKFSIEEKHYEINKNLEPKKLDTKSMPDNKKVEETKFTLSQNKPNKIKKQKFLTYSGLLNALDGVLSNQNGVITIMTTNHLDKLGDAFLRPGRIDRMFELKECNDEQIELMLRTFIDKRNKLFEKVDKNIPTPEKIEANIRRFVKKLTNKNGMSRIKPCELQYYILKYIDNIDDIFKNYNELSPFVKQ